MAVNLDTDSGQNESKMVASDELSPPPTLQENIEVNGIPESNGEIEEMPSCSEPQKEETKNADAEEEPMEVDFGDFLAEFKAEDFPTSPQKKSENVPDDLENGVLESTDAEVESEPDEAVVSGKAEQASEENVLDLELSCGTPEPDSSDTKEASSSPVPEESDAPELQLEQNSASPERAESPVKDDSSVEVIPLDDIDQPAASSESPEVLDDDSVEVIPLEDNQNEVQPVSPPPPALTPEEDSNLSLDSTKGPQAHSKPSESAETGETSRDGMEVDESSNSEPAQTSEQRLTPEESISSSRTTPDEVPNKSDSPIHIQLDSSAASEHSESADEKVVLSDESDVEFVKELPRGGSRRKTTFDMTPTKPMLTADQLRDKLEHALTRKRTTHDGERKVVDVVQTVINEQVQQTSADTVKRVLAGDEFEAFNNLSIPPSQVVQLLAAYEPEKTVRQLTSELFPGQHVFQTTGERAQVQKFKLQYAAPALTQAAYNIGFSLAQEFIYTDIIHYRNLPEKPKDIEVYQKVVSQLKPLLKGLKEKNNAYKLPKQKCELCGFVADTELVMYRHRLYPHFEGGKWKCHFCDEWECEHRDAMNQHYLTAHDLVAKYEKPMGKAPCPCCEEEFQYKGVLAQHFKICKRNVHRSRRLLESAVSETAMCNTWLWHRPPEAVTSGIKVQLVNQPGVGLAAIVPPQVSARILSGGGHIFTTRPLPSLRPAILPGSRTVTLPPGMNIQRTAQRMVRPLIRQPPVLQPLSNGLSGMTRLTPGQICEICDMPMETQVRYLRHLQLQHKQMLNKGLSDMENGPPLGCSRCTTRHWSYEGLERHLVMGHGLVTGDLLAKAQGKKDCGKCKLCGKQYAFNLLQHLVQDHKRKLCSAEITYSCDVCSYQCSSYISLEQHLSREHPPQRPAVAGGGGGPPPVPSIFRNNKRPNTAAAELGVGGPPELKRARQSRIKYTCTPCALKFEEYNQVIVHWQEKHLRKASVNLCRIDKCDMHKQELEKDCKIDWEWPEVSQEEVKEEVIILD